MRSAGFTLIELLVVISIIALMAVVGFTNFKDFLADQVAPKALGQVQSLMRLAQTNASTSTICHNTGSTTWSLKFTDKKTIELHCTNPNDFTYRTYTLENAEMTIACNRGVDLIPTVFTYTTGSGAFSSSCSDSTYPITITVSNANNADKFKSFRISKGGAIDVQ